MSMKRKAEPASVEDEEEDSLTVDGSFKAKESASMKTSPDQVGERRKKWRKSDFDFQDGCASEALGPLLEVIRAVKEGELLTILAGDHEDNLKVWKECEKSGRKYRAFYLDDRVINGENKTYAEREILISKEGGDLDQENPQITIAQRTYSNGSNKLNAHTLYFRGRLDLNRPYIFPRLGDEIPGVGCPDLHCTFRGIRDWNTVAKTAKLASCDRNVSIEITTNDVECGRTLVFDLEKNKITRSGMKPNSGVQIACSEFKGLHGTPTTVREEPGGSYPSTSSKRQKTTSQPKFLTYEQPRTIGLKLIGMGPEVEGGLRADLNIDLILKS